MSRRGFRKDGAEGEQDFELNLASIIDCFTVLVTYLLVSASFISLGAFDVGVATRSEGGDGAKGPSASVSIVLDSSHNLVVVPTGVAEKAFTIPSANGTWAFEALEEALAPFHDKWPDLKTGIVAADGGIDYRDVVRAVQVARKALPVVFLGDRQVD